VQFIAAPDEFPSPASSIEAAESQVNDIPALDEKPQDTASALEESQPATPENEVPSPVPVAEQTPGAVWRGALSVWIIRFGESLNRLWKRIEQRVAQGASRDQGVEKEAKKAPLVEPEAELIEPNVKEFNSILEPVESAKSSQEIFNDLGRQLRERREMLSLTVEEVERHIHIRAAFLHALERGTMEKLPSLVQTRGMFVNYASFLDLNVDSLLLRFADGLQARHHERHPQKPTQGKPIKVNEKVPPLSTFIAGDLLIGGGMIILLIIFTIWGVSRVMVMRSQYYPQMTAPVITNILAETLQPTNVSQQVTLIPAQNTPSTATPIATVNTPTLPASINVELNIMAVERTYMRVTVDGKVQFDGEAVPGDAYPYEAKKQVEVLVGSASGLSITYNGQNLGLMGTFGQVVDNIYEAQGVVTPTATPPPTNTATPRFSPTPTVTPSLVPTPTSGE